MQKYRIDFIQNLATDFVRACIFLIYPYSWGSFLEVPVYLLMSLSERPLLSRTLIFVSIKLPVAAFSFSALELTFSTQPQEGLRHSTSVRACVSVFCFSVLPRNMVFLVFTGLVASYTHIHKTVYFSPYPFILTQFFAYSQQENWYITS